MKSIPLLLLNQFPCLLICKFTKMPMKKFYESIKSQIEKANKSYKRKANKHRKPSIFQLGYLVWLHLQKKRFPSKRKSKLGPKANDPFEVIARIGDNAYKIALPDELGGVLATFNVGDLSPNLEDKNLSDLRTNPPQPKENDMKPSEELSSSTILIQAHAPTSCQPSPNLLLGPRYSIRYNMLTWIQVQYLSPMLLMSV